MPPRLQMRGIWKRFAATEALRGVDFQVQAGEVRALVGENGAEKSTLMKVLSGVVAADRGSTSLDGAPYTPPHPLAARRAGVCMIYQDLSLAPHLSAEQNILLGVEPGRFGWLDAYQLRRRAREALAQLGHDQLPTNVPVG